MEFDKDYSEEKRIIYKNGQYVVENKKIWLSWNPIQSKWFVEKTEIEYLGLESWYPPLSKKIKGKILIKRSAVDSYTLKPVSAYFVKEITVEADSRNPHEFINQCNGQFFCHFLNHSVVFPLAISEKEPRIKFGKEKRVTEAEAKQLIKEGVVVMSEHGASGLVTELNT